jgi:hypothetical protein
MPVAGVGPSKLFAADSTHMMVGSLANPDPATGPLTVDRIIGPQPGAIPYNYAGFSATIGSLALDTTRDYLYVGNGTSILVFHGASMANGDFVADATIGPIVTTGSLFVDAVADRLYVGDTNTNVKVFSGASLAMGSPTPRLITGMSTPIHGVAVDTTKNILYVSNDTATPSHQISVFDHADTVTNAAPSRTITPTGTGPTNFPVGGISLDAAHDVLYVAGGSASTQVMVFASASMAADVSGATAPSMILSGFQSGILNVVVDTANDRLYAVGSNGHIYLVEGVSMLSSGAVTAKDASLSNGGMLTAVTVNP